MNLYSCLVVATVVWLLSLVSSVQLRALLYSLPLPITAVLLSTMVPVDSSALIGVVLLNIFFITVTVLYHHARWPIGFADIGGIAIYVILGTAANALDFWRFSYTLCGVVGLWIVGAYYVRLNTSRTVRYVNAGMNKIARFLAIFCGSAITFFLGSLLGGLVVAFPYAGILVAIESRHDLPQFSKHFGRNSIGLVAFFSAYYYTYRGSMALSIAAAWFAFSACLLLLHLGAARRILLKLFTAG